MMAEAERGEDLSLPSKAPPRCLGWRAAIVHSEVAAAEKRSFSLRDPGRADL